MVPTTNYSCPLVSEAFCFNSLFPSCLQRRRTPAPRQSHGTERSVANTKGRRTICAIPHRTGRCAWERLEPLEKRLAGKVRERRREVGTAAAKPGIRPPTSGQSKSTCLSGDQIANAKVSAKAAAGQGETVPRESAIAPGCWRAARVVLLLRQRFSGRAGAAGGRGCAPWGSGSGDGGAEDAAFVCF